MDTSAGSRSYEVITEDGARYRQTRRHLRKTRQSYNRSKSQTESQSKQAERAAVAPVISEQQKAVVPEESEQTGVCLDPVTLQGQSESSSQPIALSEHPKTTRSGRVIKRPQYLNDFHTRYDMWFCEFFLLFSFLLLSFISFLFVGRKRMLYMVK